MTKKELAELRAKLDNPDYIKEACADIGSRLADGWVRLDYCKPPIRQRKRAGVNLGVRDEAICRDAATMSQSELVVKYSLSRTRIREILRNHGISYEIKRKSSEAVQAIVEQIKPIAKDKTIIELADLTGCSVVSMRGILHRNKIKYKRMQ